jgi:hypothetical protein
MIYILSRVHQNSHDTAAAPFAPFRQCREVCQHSRPGKRRLFADLFLAEVERFPRNLIEPRNLRLGPSQMRRAYRVGAVQFETMHKLHLDINHL